MKLAEIKIDDTYMPFAATHNFPCPVCIAAKAVLNLNKGIMQPCHDCSRKGWFIEKKKRTFEGIKEFLKGRLYKWRLKKK